MYKCCRWCINFSDGKCRSDIFTLDLSTNIESIYDDGLIEEALKESVGDIDFDYFIETCKKIKLSKAKIDALLEIIKDKFKSHLEYEVSTVIKTVLDNNLSGYLDVEISNEHEFVCNEFR